MDRRVQDGGAEAESSPADRTYSPAGANAARAVPAARGWKGVLFAVVKGISTDRIFLTAAGVAFYAIIALFPGIGAIVSIYGLFANPSSIAGHLDTLSGVAPGGGVDVIRDQLTRLAHQSGTALGIGFVISLAIALWFSNSGMTGLFDGLNVVYEKQEQRSLLKYYATTLMFTVCGIVLVLVSVAIIVAIPIVLHFLPNASVTAILLKIVRWPVLFILIAFALALIYRYAPCRGETPPWGPIIWSSIFAAAAWLCVSALFSWYVASFGSYNKTYGSLGAIFGFMTWIWLSMVVMLIGAKLDAELELRTAPDHGGNSSGDREARMANSTGPAQA